MSSLLAHRTKQRSDAPDLPPGHVVVKLPDIVNPGSRFCSLFGPLLNENNLLTPWKDRGGTVTEWETCDIPRLKYRTRMTNIGSCKTSRISNDVPGSIPGQCL